MRELARNVCELQKSWNAANTDEMKRRGVFIRREIPEWVKGIIPELAHKMGFVGSDLFAEGRDGTGQKTEIPWVRFASKIRSPSAQRGWYCVYLFEATGRGLYLALAHGSTTFIDGEFRPKPESEIRGFMAWARGCLADDISRHPGLAVPIELKARRSHLGAAYEKTTVLAKWYDANDLPSAEIFQTDAILFAAFLQKLYEVQDLGREPQTEPPEIIAVNEAMHPGAGPNRGAGQGRGLSTEERRAVERHAMGKAKSLLEAEGFKVRDVSASHSYDFEASREGVRIFVEVKGTTSLGKKVVLTAPEVALQKDAYPDNALILVHSIDLERDVVPVRASGGEVVVFRPWDIDDDALAPISFAYTVSLDHL